MFYTYTPWSEPTQRINLGALVTEYVVSSNWAVGDALGHIITLRTKFPGLLLLPLYHITLMTSSDPNLQSLSGILGGAKTWQSHGDRSGPKQGWSAPSFSTRRILTQPDHTGACCTVTHRSSASHGAVWLRCNWNGSTIALSMYDTVLKSHTATEIYVWVRRSGPMVLTRDQELICGGWSLTGVLQTCLPRRTWLDFSFAHKTRY